MRRAILGLSLLSVCAMAAAVQHPVSVLGRVYVDTNCNGIIDSGDVLVNGVDVEMQLANGSVAGIAQTGEFGQTGVYAFPSDMAPTAPNTNADYTLTILLPHGFAAKNSFPGPYSTRVNRTELAFNLPDSVTGTSASYDFLIKQSACFYSDTQCGWGSLPRCGGQTFLTQNFRSVYGQNPVVIGGINTLTFTSARAIADFLPQSGSVRVLTQSQTDPHNCRISEFAGNVLALQLNVDFSDAGVTTAFFGSLHLQKGPLAGMTVREVLDMANQALGGDLSVLPHGVDLCDLNDVLVRINQNFEDCDQNCHGYDHRHNHGCGDGRNGGWDGGCGNGWNGGNGGHNGCDSRCGFGGGDNGGHGRHDGGCDNGGHGGHDGGCDNGGNGGGGGCGCDTDWGDGYLGW